MLCCLSRHQISSSQKRACFLPRQPLVLLQTPWAKQNFPEQLGMQVLPATPGSHLGQVHTWGKNRAHHRSCSSLAWGFQAHNWKDNSFPMPLLARHSPTATQIWWPRRGGFLWMLLSCYLFGCGIVLNLVFFWIQDWKTNSNKHIQDMVAWGQV